MVVNAEKVFYLNSSTCVCSVTHSASARRKIGYGSASQLKTLKVVPCCQMRDINTMSMRECIDPKQAQLSTVHAQLELRTSRQRSCNQRVDCLLGSTAMIYGMGLWTSASCVVWSLFVVRMAIELKYRNTPQIHTGT